ncbi:MAG: hypothetical protein K2Q18_17660, partial [Bdellovibrionales bacterium]|nr:hypothetical protein [Bdellovibrionales bacterium]
SDLLTRRITGVLSGYVLTSVYADNKFTVPCSASAVSPSVPTNVKLFESLANFSDGSGGSNVQPVSQYYLKSFMNFCPSLNVAAAGEIPNFKCAVSEFDMVSSALNGAGFLRLKDSYFKLLTTNEIPFNHPIWIHDPEDPYPKLFLAD